VLSKASLERLRKSLRGQIDQRRATSSKGTDALRKQLASLEIDRAADYFLRAPSEVLDLTGSKLTALKRQREMVQDELRLAEAVVKPADATAEVNAMVGNLWRLGGNGQGRAGTQS